MLSLLFITVASLTGAEVTVQVVPQGIESVNGSNITMGCASPLVNRSGVMVCNNSESYLVDGCSPAINTSTSNWASQLVTLRKVSDHAYFNFDHVLLTFSFNTAVSLTSIELDLFLCPEWGIGAARILVYAHNSTSLVLGSVERHHFITQIELPNSSCNSLSNVSIPLERRVGYFYLWHILVDLHVYSIMTIEWVHVGEVRFFGRGITNSDRSCYRQSTGGMNLTVVISSTVHASVLISSTVHTSLTDSQPTSSNYITANQGADVIVSSCTDNTAVVAGGISGATGLIIIIQSVVIGVLLLVNCAHVKSKAQIRTSTESEDKHEMVVASSNAAYGVLSGGKVHEYALIELQKTPSQHSFTTGPSH